MYDLFEKIDNKQFYYDGVISCINSKKPKVIKIFFFNLFIKNSRFFKNDY